uniref:Uncharacterized protein n=1 Tax=Parastrongyloides trichosuri TaxID=131310 RepID=A0A0N5A6D2_PARTI
MLLILLLIVPIISSWPVPSSNYDGVHCYNERYTILLDGTFWCHGQKYGPKLELWQFVGESGSKVNGNIQLQNVNELHYNKTFNYRDSVPTLHVSLKIFHSCDTHDRSGCRYLHIMKIPDNYIYCNGTYGPSYNFNNLDLSGVGSQVGECIGDLFMPI